MSLQVLRCVQGDDAYFDIPVEMDGAPMDITGWSFWFTAKSETSAAAGDDTALFQLSTDNGGIALAYAAGGLARAHLLPEHTAGKEPGRYLFDVQARQPGGLTSTIARGFFHLLPQITRA